VLGGVSHNRGERATAIAVLAAIVTLVSFSVGDSGAAVPGARAHSLCQVPHLIGHSLAEALHRAAHAGCQIRIRDASTGALIDLATERPAGERLVSRQQPRAGSRAGLVTAWIRALCFESADPGPGLREPQVTRGPTMLVSGLFLDGGPLRRVGRCQPGTSSPGTIQVLNPTDGQLVASRTVAAGQLARIALSPGTYAVEGTFANATRNGQPITTLPRDVTLEAGTVVRQDVVENIP